MVDLNNIIRIISRIAESALVSVIVSTLFALVISLYFHIVQELRHRISGLYRINIMLHTNKHLIMKIINKENSLNEIKNLLKEISFDREQEFGVLDESTEDIISWYNNLLLEIKLIHKEDIQESKDLLSSFIKQSDDLNRQIKMERLQYQCMVNEKNPLETLKVYFFMKDLFNQDQTSKLKEMIKKDEEEFLKKEANHKY
jgi:hypothetical protein